MEILATAAVAAAAAGYALAGGAALGLSVLLPWLAADPAERRAVADAVRPWARAGRCWLVALLAAAALAAPAGADGLLLPQLALVTAGESLRWIALAAADGRPRLLAAGSWTALACWSWWLAVLLFGGGVFALVGAVSLMLLTAAHGLAAGVRRLTGRPFQRARLLTGQGPQAGLLPLTAGALAVLPLLLAARAV